MHTEDKDSKQLPLMSASKSTDLKIGIKIEEPTEVFFLNESQQLTEMEQRSTTIMS